MSDDGTVIEISRYELGTGRVIAHLRVPAQFADLQMNTGEAWVAGHHDPDTVMVIDGEATARQPSPIVADKETIVADGDEAVTLSAIPDGAIMSIVGPGISEHGVEVNGGVVTFDAQEAGAYVFTFACWPARDSVVIINAL